MRLLLSHGWQFFLYTAGLAFSSLKEWELALSLYTCGIVISLYTAGTASSLYTGPIAPLI